MNISRVIEKYDNAMKKKEREDIKRKELMTVSFANTVMYIHGGSCDGSNGIPFLEANVVMVSITHGEVREFGLDVSILGTQTAVPADNMHKL